MKKLVLSFVLYTSGAASVGEILAVSRERSLVARGRGSKE